MAQASAASFRGVPSIRRPGTISALLRSGRAVRRERLREARSRGSATSQRRFSLSTQTGRGPPARRRGAAPRGGGLTAGTRAAAHLALPLEFWDERLTTVAAERVLLEADMSRRRRREVVDKVAATLILQGYLARQP